MTGPLRLGVIGTGALGGAIVRACLSAGVVAPDTLSLANRRGRLEGFADWPGLRATAEAQEIVAASEMILLALPPASLPDLRLDAGDRPVLSVVAGASTAHLARLTGSVRILRAMSSPAAESGLAFSPVFAVPAALAEDSARAARLLGACGMVEFVAEETHVDVFTALTGPVPGFVALFARAMADFAISEGVDPQVADRAIRQLFLASGRALAADAPTPAEHVRAMIEYAGTTAAGLERLEALGLGSIVAEGLGAATRRARNICPE